MLNSLIDRFQAKFPPAKLTTLLTPTVFVPASIWITGYVAKHFPGLPAFTTGQVTAFMIAGGFAAMTASFKRVDGWQKHEKREADAELVQLRDENAAHLAVIEKAQSPTEAEMALENSTFIVS